MGVATTQSVPGVFATIIALPLTTPGPETSRMLQLPHRTAQTLAALAASLLLLGGCAPGLLDRGAAEYEMHAASARQYQSAGDWATAAEAWMRAAEAARGDARDLPLVAAAEAWFRAGDLERARSALTGMSASPGAELAARRTLIEARLLLRADRAGEALARLAGVPMGPGDPSATDCLRPAPMRRSPPASPRSASRPWCAGKPCSRTPAQRSANQRRTWRRLQEAAAAGLPLETPAGADPLVAAWLELGREPQPAAGNPFRLRAALTAWREQNPEHPAALELVGTLLQEYRAMTEFPQRVALLLPLSGRHAGAAGVVRDGFIAAYLAQGDEGERPALRFYDTTALGATAAYDLAARDGADFIVGPLLKEDLAELAGAELPAVPALALNWVDEGYGLPGYIFQFALAPEEEAARPPGAPSATVTAAPWRWRTTPSRAAAWPRASWRPSRRRAARWSAGRSSKRAPPISRWRSPACCCSTRAAHATSACRACWVAISSTCRAGARTWISSSSRRDRPRRC
jgi:uncharacterized protein